MNSVPKNARSKRAMQKKEAHLTENPKTTLLLRGEKASQIVQLALADLNALKVPFTQKFTKKNSVRPFEDASSLEFFSEKNDCSLMLFGHHSKKRPHAINFVRFFDHKVLDMLEVYVDPEGFRSISQFKGVKKASVGVKPMLAFSGSAWESPQPNAYTLAKSLFIDMFKGQDASSVDVEGLQFLIQFSVAEETDEVKTPAIKMRVYKISTKRSGQKVPRVEVEEMGPRIDLRIGRVRDADEGMMREALKRPKQLEPKTKKNVQTDLLGDKIGRIHVGRQDIDSIQTRKMKGLKRHLDVDDEMEDADDTKVPRLG